MQIVDLRCEYAANPLGIDARRPRLSWKLASARRGARQTAYQILVTLGETLIWNSGRVESDQSIHIPYGGPALNNQQRLDWKVRVWDENDEATSYSETCLVGDGAAGTRGLVWIVDRFSNHRWGEDDGSLSVSAEGVFPQCACHASQVVCERFGPVRVLD